MMPTSKTSKWFKLAWLSVCLLVGCNDLPNTNYPLLPTPSVEVVSPNDGRGSYDWTLEQGKFLVERPLESNFFLPVDEKRVRALVSQACANPSVPAYQAPAWVDEELRQTINVCVHQLKTVPDRILSLTREPLAITTTKKPLVALNYDGSRLLLIEDKLTLWDTKNGKLLKERECPTDEAKFAFLAPAGDRAILFDSHKGYVISFVDDAATTSQDISPKDIRQVVSSAQRDVFFVHAEPTIVRLNTELQIAGSPNLTLGMQGLLGVSDQADCVGTFDDGLCNLLNLNDNSSRLIGVVGQKTAQSIIVLQGARMLAAFPHAISHIQLDANGIPAASAVANTSRLADRNSEIDCAQSIPVDDPQDTPWMAVCVQRRASDKQPGEYSIFDLNMDDGLVSLPTMVGRKRPELFELSNDGRVLVTAGADEPIKVRFRGHRLVRHAELDTLVEQIVELFLAGRHEEGEELIDSLEQYAASVPYTLGTRQLLDLKSPVAKKLVEHLIEHVDEAPNTALQTWLDAGSTLARLVHATQLASLRITESKERWDANNQEVRVLVEDLLSAKLPPTLAFEILSNLTWMLKLDDGPLVTHFAHQFERDPLNPQLHLCMTSYHTPQRAGDIGQPGAYLAKLCEFLPPEERDALYTLSAIKILPAIAPMRLTRMPTMPIASSARSAAIPCIYDLSDGPYGPYTLTSAIGIGANELKNQCKLNAQRLARGLAKLVQPDSHWGREVPQSLWPELQTVVLFDFALSPQEPIVDAYLRLYPFVFSDEFTGGPMLRTELEKRLMERE